MFRVINLPLYICIAVFFLIYAARASADDINIKDAPVYGDAFVSGSTADARNLIPILASDTSSSQIVSMLFNGLVKYSKGLKIIPDLAESWRIQDDGLTIIFHLKKDVKWHDGHPFTSADVEFTYKKLIDPDTLTPYGGDFEKVKDFIVIDPYTIKVSYDEPFAPALASWSMPVMPKHILEDAELSETGFSRDPIGTGPYVFKRWRSGQRMDLDSNHSYFEHRPYIDRYIFRIIPDSTTMFLELQTGSVDAMGLTPLQYTRLTDTETFRRGFRKIRYPSFGYTYLGFNLDTEMFKDREVRQAISYAIDKEEIINGVLMGLGSVSTGPFPRESWAYNEKVRAFGFDKQRALKLLSKAGWRDTDNDGWLDKNGKRFEFTIISNKGNDQRRMTAEIIQRRLMDVGIEVKIRMIEWAVFINEFVDKRMFDAILLGWSLSRDPDCYDIWHSTKTGPGEFNFIGYKNPEVDRLLEEGRGTFDYEKRKNIYNEIHRLLYEDQAYVFLYVPDALTALSRRFEGVEVSQIGIMHNFIDWYVPKDRHRYKR